MEPVADGRFFALTRHRVADLVEWLPRARNALAPLTAQAGCTGGHIGASIDDPELMTVITRWESVGAYRRALSAFEVKAVSVPFLSTAIDEPSAFEVLHENGPAGARDFTSARAADADTIRIRESARADVPPRA